MEHMTDSLGMLMLSYDEYVKNCQKFNKEVKSFFGFMVSSITGNL